MNAALLIIASALALMASSSRTDDEIVYARVVLSGLADDAKRAASEARRIAQAVGAAPELVDAFAQHAVFMAGSPDSYAIRFQLGPRRACLLLVRTKEVSNIIAFSPQADFDLLIEMLSAHERRHCHHELSIEADTPVLDILRAEVEADAAALGILSPYGMDGRHDTARQAWLLWRNMDAFLTGKPTHWTLPSLFGIEPSEAGIEQALRLQKQATRILLGKEAGDPGAVWETLRDTEMGALLPPWPDVLAAIRHAYGDEPGAMRRALRGEISRVMSR